MKDRELEELAARMLRLFEGYAGAHGTHGRPERNAAKGGKLEIKKTAQTVREAVTVEHWKKHLLGLRPLGITTVRADGTCLWGMVDIDQYDVNHAMLADRLEKAKIPMLVCKSKSDGAHVVACFDEPTSASDVMIALKQVAASFGYGQSEIYPKQSRILEERGDLGNWIVMPYFGSAAVDRRTVEKAFSEGCCGQVAVKRTGAEMTLQEFATACERVRGPISRLERRRAARRNDDEPGVVLEGTDDDPLVDGPPCLQHLAAQGFPEGTRNNGLMALGVYAKKRHGSNWKTVVEDFNRDLMTPPLPHQEVGDIIKSLDRRDYHYRCKDEPICSHCNSILCRTRRFGVKWSEDTPMIGGLSVLKSDPPLWFLDVEGERIELTTDQLQNFKQFHLICMERLQICFQMLKQETWLKIVALAMADAIAIDVPPEVGISGQFQEHLEDFLTNRHRGERAEDLFAGKPYEREGRHLFRLRDLQDHLDREGFKGYTRGRITTRLRDMRGGAEFLNVSGKGVNIWWVPSDAFQRTPAAPKIRAEEDPV